MGMEGSWSEVVPDVDQNYLYNGKERDSDLGLNWDHYGFRMYDASIGRFTGVDPIADQYAHASTYNYAENEPVGSIDLWGLQRLPINLKDHAKKIINNTFGTNVQTGGSLDGPPRKHVSVSEIKAVAKSIAETTENVAEYTEAGLYLAGFVTEGATVPFAAGAGKLADFAAGVQVAIDVSEGNYAGALEKAVVEGAYKAAGAAVDKAIDNTKALTKVYTKLDGTTSGITDAELLKSLYGAASNILENTAGVGRTLTEEETTNINDFINRSTSTDGDQ
jgi:RHS repeat-associated protein